MRSLLKLFYLKIKYLSIPKLIEKTLNKASFSNINSIKDVLEIDNDARQTARNGYFWKVLVFMLDVFFNSIPFCYYSYNSCFRP